MRLCQVSYHLLVSANGICFPPKNTRFGYSYQLHLCNYEISLATLSATPISYYCLLTTQ